jgi:hypothetical protein
MLSRARKFSLLTAVVTAALALGACGDSHTKVTTGTYAGESGASAPYLDVGPLSYEVQLSRQLNPLDSEDAQYLQGLSPTESKLAPGQEWFGVFLQVYNNGSAAEPAASSLTVSDTQGNVYRPITPNQSNLFVYRGGEVPAKGRLPTADSAGAFAPTQGALLLFKIQIQSLDNRPLKLKIVDPTDAAETASAELDV